MDLRFDERQWLLVEVAGAPGALATELRRRGLSRVASVSVGGEGLDTNGPLARWRLVARTEAPESPYLADLLLLDNRHADLDLISPMTTVADGVGLPMDFDLQPNYPNPFNPMTVIEFAVPVEGAAVRLYVFDTLGQRIAVLVDATLPAGVHRAAWDGRDLGGRPVASGVYFARLFTGDATRVRSMLLLR